MIPDASGVTIGDVRASGLKDLTVASIIKPCENLTVNLDYHYFQAGNGQEQRYKLFLSADPDRILTGC